MSPDKDHDSGIGLMNMRSLRLSLCILVFGLLGVSSAQAQSGSFEGTVTDVNENPLPDVNVVLERAEDGDVVQGTSTSADGTFRLDAVRGGTYRLVASAVGYGEATEKITIEEGTREHVTVQLRTQRHGLEEVVVQASRRPETLGSVASSVSVLDSEALGTQRGITSDLGGILAQEVPGLAPSSGSLSNYGQTLRGRTPFVMIDGVPQNTPLRDAARYLRTLSPEVIERVEVVRGASALYGYGATGGAVNIITKESSPDLEATSQVGIRASAADLQDSFTGRLHQSVAGQSQGVEYVASGSYERWGQFYDGEDRLIPQDPRGQGGLAGANELNLLAKVGAHLTDQQRFTASVNYYTFFQHMKYGREPGTFGEAPTSAVAEETIPGKDPGTRNAIGQLRYEHADVFGSQVRARVYGQDYTTRFGYADFYPDDGGQGVVKSTKLGIRTDATTSLGLTPGSELLWGVDALRDQTAQPLEDGRIFVPEMTQTSMAPFAQIRVPVGNRLTVRGGVRYEALTLAVDGFTTLFPVLDTNGDGTPDERNEVDGGTLTYDNTVFNLGAVVTVAEPLDVLGSFEQGFSVSDVGRVLRGTGASSFEQLQPEAKTVNSYEAGVRIATPTVDATATGFYNTSELGSTYGDLPELEIVRSPERIHGVEVTTDVQVVQAVTVGGSFTWLEGKRDANDDGDYETYLPGNRIPPAKSTGYLEVTPIEGWTSRIQILYSGSRDRFEDEERSYGEGPIERYTLIGLSSRIAAGPGVFRIGVENLFDTYYYPVRSQFTNFGFAYTPGRGRTLSLSYAVQW